MASRGERVPALPSRDELIATAMEQTGLDDLGDVPFAEGLDALLASWHRDAHLDDRGRGGAVHIALGALVKRLQLVRDRRENSAIAAEQIVAPVFIIGLPRTGSTHLHALLAEVEGVRTPRFWELNKPSPPPELATYGTDPRIADIQALVDLLGPGIQRLHTMGATQPEQCNGLMDWSFVNQAWCAMWEITSYTQWLFDNDYVAAFEAHRRTLQHLQWRVPGRWVLKYPKHLLALDALVAAYPDARFVWTHRDPGVVVPSVLSLTSFYRSQNPSYDPLLFGREWAEMEELCAHRGIAARSTLPGFEERCIDVHFADLMRDPHGVLERICAHVAMPYGAPSRARVQAYLDAHPRGKHGRNEYEAATWGLDADQLRRRFRFYTDRFGVAIEGGDG